MLRRVDPAGRAAYPRRVSSPQPIPGLHALAGRYDALLCDVWGVIHNGVESFPAACDALVRWNAEHSPVVLISNSPRPSADVTPQLRALGVPDAAWAGFVTSGDVTREAIAARAPAGQRTAVWHIGAPRDGVLLDGLAVERVGPEEAAFVVCSGPQDDERETAEDYRGRLELCVGRGLEMVCANPDRVVQRGDRLIPCGGALADLYEALGGRVTMAGKPYPPIYEATLAEAERLAGRPLARDRVLAVGDGLLTDVAGANRAGLPLLFVATGIHAGDIVGAEGALDPERAGRFLAEAGARADYVCGDLAW